MRTLLAVVALLALAGCNTSPRPARTEVTPGESQIKTEREEVRPSESLMRIHASNPKVTPVRIRIVVPEEPHQCDR